MAKRFTDTGIWDKAWFRKLPPRLKEAWRFLCEKCDQAGVWNIDIEALCFNVGEQVTKEEILSSFGDRIKIIDGDKLFINSFIEFQYGELSENCMPHRPVLEKLKKYKIDVKGYRKGIERVSNTLEDKDKEKDKEKEKDIKGGVGENFSSDFKNQEKEKPTREEIENAYSLYPRKEGKTKGIIRLQSESSNLATFALIKTAIKNYSEQCKRQKTETKYIKHFSTFMNCWRDYLDIAENQSTLNDFNKDEELNKIFNGGKSA